MSPASNVILFCETQQMELHYRAKRRAVCLRGNDSSWLIVLFHSFVAIVFLVMVQVMWVRVNVFECVYLCSKPPAAAAIGENKNYKTNIII